MQSLHVLDSSLSYQNPEPLEGPSLISSQWSTPFASFGHTLAPEPPVHEAYPSIPRDYTYSQPAMKYPKLSRPHTCESYSAYPSYNYNTYHNSYNHSQDNYNQYSVHSHIYPSSSAHLSLTEMVGNVRTDHNDLTHHHSHVNQSDPLSVPEYYPPRMDMTELGVSSDDRLESLSLSRSRQKIRENHSRLCAPPIKSEFFNSIDAQADDVGNKVNRENLTHLMDRPLNDQLTMSSFREALGIVDPKNTPSTSIDVQLPSNCHFPVPPPETVGTMGLGLTSSKQEEVLKAAKSLFSKRTRTLYQWLCPDASKTKLKASVTAAWDTLSEPEKHFYISQVLGRFGLQESSLMVNPQLDGIKGLPGENMKHSMRASICKARAMIEDQEAVNALFDSCDDSHNWTSFRRQKKTRVARKIVARASSPEQRKKRKYTRRNPVVGKRTGKMAAKMAAENDKNMGERCLGPSGSPPVENVELNGDAEKYKFAGEEEFWNNPLNPEELFPEINF